MRSSAYGVVIDIAVQSALLFFLIGGVFSLIYGAGLLARSDWVFRMNEKAKRWISTRQAMRPLDAQHDFWGAFYHHCFWSGLILALGSGYVLITLVQYRLAIVNALLGSRAAIASELALNALWWLLACGAAAGLVVGALLMLRPTKLRGVDQRLAKTYSARKATKFLEVMNLGPDQWIVSYPRVSGGIISLGSLYIVYSLGTVLLARM